MKAKNIELSEEQLAAIDKFQKWFNSTSRSAMFRLGGYAGTGKTTLIKELIHIHGFVAVCAFTGKAAYVLRKKGVPASTIHSLIYDTQVNPKTMEYTFFLRDKTHDRLKDLKLIIVDEASMVAKDLMKDLLSLDIPLLCIGDPGQLPPVKDTFNIMTEPDVVLKTIHRQDADNPILLLAHEVRNGGFLDQYKYSNDQCRIQSKTSFDVLRLASADQVICATNRTRIHWNSQLRMHLLPEAKQYIEPGDKLICLKNNMQINVFNGMQVTVKKVIRYSDIKATCLVEDDIGNTRYLDVWVQPFNPEFQSNHSQREIMAKCSKRLAYCTYGYVITCHKSQGSEWDHVILWDEWMPPKVWDMDRWRYTGITRAAKKLEIAI